MKLVYVKWVDAMAADIGWKTIEDAIEWGEDIYCAVDEVGYIVDENDNYLLLASKVNGELDKHNVMVSGLMRIPKKYIIEQKELKVI
jgi:hypothetical protein